MSKIKVGIVGAGGIPRAHLPRLSERTDVVELAAVADVNGEAAAKMAEEFGFGWHGTDYRELIPRVDAVLICVPTFLHRDIAVMALEAGKPVFSEKPIARTLEQAEAMQAAAERTGTPLQVGFVRRFDEDWMTMLQAVQAGKLGGPTVWRDVQAHAGPPSPWFNTDELGGGPFLDGCIHNIDFGNLMYGPVEWVFTHGRSLRSTSTAIDTGTATIRYASGDELLLAWSWGLPRGVQGDRVFEVYGPEGLMKWVPAEGGRIIRIQRENDAEDFEIPADTISQAFADQMDEFLAVAAGDAKPRAGVAEGIASLKVALAILESGRKSEVVRL